MSLLDHALTQTCVIVTHTLNAYGERVQDSTRSADCRFRWITELNHVTNREDIRSDAMLWLKSDEEVEEGTIVEVDNALFRIQTIIKARRLQGDTVYFKKCLLEKQTDILTS